MRQQLAIGDFIFSVYQDTDYETWTRTAESGIATIDRAGQHPATQRTGMPLQTISLNGQILGNTGSSKLDRLRGFINKEPQMVVKGDGTVLDLWTVTRVTETGNRLIDDGTALKTTFQVDLQEYKP
ncbi:phage tail protein [Oceanospirillum sediminis]|uniref:Phage tail protein n=1 Tax=Oceanospirillum sediminis TaxID=2760088 RepID=A0A839IX48_9GAMM|nr:phage tail protein [Oceanospirillum sediminis]MBB1489362.1 phage tail protein [Oceanospirillum sediminis]